jgi:hypothetical protein
MAWMIALALILVSIAAGVFGMVTHNMPLFIGAWVALTVATLAFIVSLLLMLNDARRRRLEAEQFEPEPAEWLDDD